MEAKSEEAVEASPGAWEVMEPAKEVASEATEAPYAVADEKTLGAADVTSLTTLEAKERAVETAPPASEMALPTTEPTSPNWGSGFASVEEVYARIATIVDVERRMLRD